MKGITDLEMKAVRTIVKTPETAYNANSLAKVIGITPMGSLKILKRLEHQSILKPTRIGKAVIYKANIFDLYPRRYIAFILAKEAQDATPQAKRWINELQKIKNADIIILFGSVLDKPIPNDIDALLVTDQKRFAKLQEEIKAMNSLNIKKIHPMYQTAGDMITNIRKKDKPLLNAIKGIIIRGEEMFLEAYDESRKE